MTLISAWAYETWSMINESAPWLLFAFLLSGLIHVILPTSVIVRHLQAPGFKSVLKGALVGVPLPLCSCSVIPIAKLLQKKGASRGAIASFMVSTPEIGVDSFLLSFGILGSVLAMFRVIAAFLSAMLVGVLVSAAGSRDNSQTSQLSSSCCKSEPEEPSSQDRFSLKAILRYGFVTIIDDLSVLLVIGFVAAGLISAIVPPDFFQSLALSPFMMMVAILFVSLPLYICATSATPLAAALIAKGLNPGAALVLLLAGPASNIATMLVVRSIAGGRGLFCYIAGITLVSLAAGLAVDLLFAKTILAFITLPSAGHVGHIHYSSSVPALLLCGLLGMSLWRRFRIWKGAGKSGSASCH